MFVLRKALRERPKEHRYVVTIPGVGYRFVAPVTRERAGRTSANPKDRQEAGSGPVAGPHAVAVLPFTGLGSVAGEKHIELGITDAIITKLSSFRQISVRPINAVLRFQGQDPVAAATELGVDIVLHGTIQQADSRLRIAVHMISAEDGVTLWTHVLDEKMVELFAVEDSIAEQVTRAVLQTLSDDDRQRQQHRHTERPEAYQTYLTGRFFWNKRTEAGLRTAIARFEEAIKHDPQFAAAHVGLADCYNLLSAYGSLSPREGFPLARAAAEQALRIDARLSEAHSSLAYATLHFNWDWDTAGQEFRLAINLNPNDATAHQWYAAYQAALGRFALSIAEIQQALRLEPLSLMINADLGWLLFYARHYDRAIEQLRRTIEMEPNFALSHWLLGLNYQQTGRLEEAMAEFRWAVMVSPDAPFALASLGHILGRTGKRKEAAAVLAQLKALSKHRYVSPHSLATVYVGLNQKAEAIAWLNKACDERCNWVAFLNVDPVFDSLRTDRRLKAVLGRVGFSNS